MPSLGGPQKDHTPWPHLLRIDSSSSHAGSHSRAPADAAKTAWREGNPAGTVTTRDVTDGTIPVIAQNTITGFLYRPRGDDAGSARGDGAVGLTHRRGAGGGHAADLRPDLQLRHPRRAEALDRSGNPHWSHLLQRRRRLRRAGQGRSCHPVLRLWRVRKRRGQPFEAANFVDPYLTLLMGFLGIEDVRTAAVEATTADEATVQAAAGVALADAARIAA